MLFFSQTAIDHYYQALDITRKIGDRRGDGNHCMDVEILERWLALHPLGKTLINDENKYNINK